MTEGTVSMLAAGRARPCTRRRLVATLSAALTALALPGATFAVTLPSGFQESVVFSGLVQPTALRFAADGRVFVAEKSGLIKVFDSLTDPTPTIFADLRTNVHNYWDRGLLGLALDPSFPTKPYVYVLYTLDAAPGGTPPRWGTFGGTSDNCPDPPGSNTNGCVVAGRVSRLQASGDVMVGTEQVLLENWCQQFPSHSIGSLTFASDGALYVSGGEGASFDFADWGQTGYPQVNPCGDPPGGVGGTQAPPTAEGGALRAQDIRTTSDPVAFSGAILRVDPATGAALPDNPLVATYPNAGRIIAYGLRNPFRITTRPGTNEIWIGDVGWSDWEEIDRIGDATDSIVENFGWPCYEGIGRQPAYEAAGLNLCQSLYNAPGSATDPVLTYKHDQQVIPGESCGSGSSSISGLAFYGTGAYPDIYDGALFFADYSRSCIWALLADANGDPDPNVRVTFAAGASGPVDLEIGPGGDLFYADLNGAIHRISYTSSNQPPIALIQADKTNGVTPLSVHFDGSGSFDLDPGDTLQYSWDLNGDGVFGDATAVAPSRTYKKAGTYRVRLRVTDSHGAQDTDSILITVGNTAPTATITTPLASTKWNVGTTVSFSGSATDPQQGTLPNSALTWTLIVHHCPSNCHTHTIQTFAGVASGSFAAPDHSYPSFLELQLTATDAGGLQDTKSVLLYPNTVTLSFNSVPTALTLAVGSGNGTTPFARTAIVGSANSLSAPSPQSLGGVTYTWSSWSDGGARSHLVTAPAVPITYVASFTGGATSTTTPGAAPTATPTRSKTPTPTGISTPTRTPTPGVGTCGNGVRDTGEQCDDGNSIGGDCCSATCQVEVTPCNLTHLGTIVARITAPLGGGNKNLEVIRDGDKPPVGNTDSARQYDTYTGAVAADDWIGYTYPIAQTFTRVVFQEGKNFADGGWFTTLAVQVRRNGVWTAVAGLTSTPAYPANDGVSYETYTFDFSAVTGDGIRLDGAPGGSADFISVGELEVYGGLVVGASAPTPVVTPTGVPTVGPTATPSTANLAPFGTIIARVTVPTGGGSTNLGVIRDGDKPPVGNTDSARQYDTYTGAAAAEDWIGYTFASPQSFTRVVFQEGKNFADGGWFDTLSVQVRQSGVWITVAGLTITPAYPANDGVSYETYVLTFPPVTGDGIRLDGAPGGNADFISVGELEVYGTGG
ncbi:MAG: PQQ-dependent sugar dehydrogenase [Deltaproteobacteria bacterium]|nr:PQQ-dependent sugar dehydrogenase [Deltaproteobacteria bacterium]